MTKRDIMIRYNEHIRCASSNHDLNNDYVMPLYNAMRKYGKDSFHVEDILSKELNSYKDAEILEGQLIQENMSLLHMNGYNLNHMNDDGSRTYETEIKAKLIENNKGVKNPFFGKKHSEETRKKLSEKAKERLSVPENNPRYGYQYTEEDKARHRESKKKFGRPFMAEGVKYQTLSEAAEKYNLTKQAIQFRLKSNTYEDWYWI
jgi:group I intron endonuclease